MPIPAARGTAARRARLLSQRRRRLSVTFSLRSREGHSRSLSASPTTTLATLNLGLADFASTDKGINAGFRQRLACFIHAKAQGLSFDTVLRAVPMIIVGASLLHSLAVSVLSRGRANRKREDDRSE